MGEGEARLGVLGRMMAHRASTINACFSKAMLAFGLMAFGDAHQSYPP